jgi:hypothetical protein
MRSVKFYPLKIPQKCVNFSQNPLQNLQRSKDADRLNPSETTSNVVTLQKNLSIGGWVGH